MKFKTVKSKSGKVYTYDASRYKYKHKSTKGLTLVGKGGRVDKKNIQKFKDVIDANATYSDSEKRYLKADLDAMVNQRSKSGQKMTTSGFMAHLEKSKISKMFTNAGYSTAEVASQYGISEAELLDTTRWNDDKFTSSSGVVYTFTFTYQGDIFTI